MFTHQLLSSSYSDDDDDHDTGVKKKNNYKRTSDISVTASYCREMFQFDLRSAILKKRAEKFDSALLN